VLPRLQAAKWWLAAEPKGRQFPLNMLLLNVLVEQSLPSLSECNFAHYYEPALPAINNNLENARSNFAEDVKEVDYLQNLSLALHLVPPAFLHKLLLGLFDPRVLYEQVIGGKGLDVVYEL
jgi:hypothetical protein